MKSEDLAQYVREMSYEAVGYAEPSERVTGIIEQAVDRIMGVGHEQYSEGDKQKFELVPIDKLMEWAEEETVDQINYGVMTLVRLRDPENGYNPEHLRDLEAGCLDLIENAVIQTINIRDMRRTLSSAEAN
jgi:hypothetical protein